MKYFKTEHPFQIKGGARALKKCVSVLSALLIIINMFVIPLTVNAAEEETTEATKATQSSTEESKPTAKSKGKISTGASTKSQTTGDGETSGTCGDDLTWSYDSSTTTLTISGTGDMPNYTSKYGNNGAPWAWDFSNRITSVIIEDGITSIGNYTFDDCSELTSIIIPNSVRSIGKHVFSGCQKLMSCPNIPIGCNTTDETFYGTRFAKGKCGDNLYSTLENGVLTITGSGDMYNNHGENGELPWRGSTSYIESINLPSGLTSIGKSAFDSCGKITSIEIPDKVTSIGPSAFGYCSNLFYRPIIPNNCTVADNAFVGCEFATENSFGNGLIWLFRDDTLIIRGSGSIPNYTKKTSNLPPWYSLKFKIETVIIEDGITSIGNYAFQQCSKLTSVTIPNSVITIGECAFSNCTELDTVIIHNNSNLTNISFYAFEQCEQLKKRPAIPDNCYVSPGAFANCGFANGVCGKNASWLLEEGTLTISGTGDMSNYFNPKTSSDYAPWHSREAAIYNIIIEDGITQIGNYAFSYCSNLKDVVVPNSVTNIGEGAFYFCPKLINITIPNNVINIGDYAFYNCEYLIDMSFPNNCNVSRTAISGFFGSSEPNELTLLKWNYDYSNKTIEISGTNHMMDFNYYHNNPKRPAWETIDDSITLVIKEGVKSIGNYAFDNCKNLISVTIPNSVTTIGTSAFRNCLSLTNVAINDGVNLIGANAFYDCIGLKSIIIPDNVETIASEAFAGCTNLSSVIIGNDVTKIGYAAFAGCQNANIVVPDTVKTINNFAFYDCNMIICPMDSYTYNLLTGDNFTQYRTSNTMVVGIVTAKSQLSYIFKKKNNKTASSITNNSKSKISTGASAKYVTGEEVEEEIEEEVLTPEQIAENLSHVQCYVVKDLDVDETLTFDSDLDVTLHLNDFETDSKGNVKVDNNGKIIDGEPHTLTASTRDAMIEVPGNGKLTIEATSETNGGLINTKGAVFDVKDGGSLTIKNGTYSEDVSEYIADNKVMGKTDGLYTVLNPTTEDMTLDNDGREVIMPGNQDTFARNELVGVQMRAAEEREYLNEGDGQTHIVNVGEGMRFVSVVRSDILRGAEDYGYVLVKGKSIDNMNARKSDIYVGSDGCTTVSLKGSKNTLANTAYSSANLNEGKYKYLTAAIKDIDDDNTAIGARFYIKRADGTYVYADYTCCATMGMIKAA